MGWNLSYTGINPLSLGAFYWVGTSYIQKYVQLGTYYGVGTSHMQEPIKKGAYNYGKGTYAGPLTEEPV